MDTNTSAFVALALVLNCCLFAVLCLPQPTPTNSRPAYVECVASDECSFDSCCVLGMGRYSIPTCQKKVQLYENCRPASDDRVNSTVMYPDGQMVSLYNIHMVMCPCAEGLFCDYSIGKCVEFDGNPSINDLFAAPTFDD